MFAFDKSSQFSFDKEAGVPCRHLGGHLAGRLGENFGEGHGCNIHNALAEKGFRGCIGFTCNGAGQRVIQDCFGGKSWRDDSALIAPMMELFRQACILHEWLLLLDEAGKLPLSAAQQERRQALVAMLTPDGKLTEDWLSRIVVSSGSKTQIYDFLHSLRAAAQGRYRGKEAENL